MSLYKNGLRAGYTEHRYGKQHNRPDPRLPSVAIQVRNRRILEGDRLLHVIARTKEMIRDWRFNPWEREGEVRESLRAALLSGGHDWTVSDLQAEEILRRAFNELGRGVEKRPTKAQGQPEATIPVENCQRCGLPLDDDDIAARRRYCSEVCSDSAKVRRNEVWQQHRDATWKAAWHLMRKDAAPVRNCAGCDKPFQTTHDAQQYCSSQCAGAARRSAPIHVCEVCNADFPHYNKNKPGRWCSVTCRDIGLAREASNCTCEGCGTTFAAKKPGTRFCSPKCYGKWHYQQQKLKKATADTS